MDRVSDEWKQYAVEPTEDLESNEQIDDRQSVNKFDTFVTVGLIGIVLLVMVSIVLVLMITHRRQRTVQAVDWSTHALVNNDEGTSVDTPREEAPDLLSNVPPPPLMSPPLPPEGLPAGWTMEQWHHYGAEYLSRRG